MVESLQKQIITITGISGYVGSQTCLLFLNSGKYHVRGTVRNKNNEEKIAPLRKAFGEKFEELELVEADLLDEESINRAIQGSTYVAHIASPFITGQPKHEDELIKPAVNGTLAVLKACRINQVKRVVITSSIATIVYPLDIDRPDDGLYTEEYWSNVESPGGS